MADLCSISDVTALGGSGSQEQVMAMIGAASARFCQEAGSRIVPTSHSQVLRVHGGCIRLPQLPVTQVTGIRMVSEDGTPGAAVAGWVFDGINAVDVSGQVSVINAAPAADGSTVWVEWDAGHDPVPDDIRWCVAHMVVRALSAPPPAVAGETIGDYSWRGGSWTASGAMSMTPDERLVAAAYRPRRTSIPVTLA